MSDLVALQESAEFLRTVKAATGQDDAQFSLASVRLQRAAARITALETALAEAEGRVIAEVVAWCLREMYEPFTPLERAKALKSIATALETGEWHNAQSV